MERLTTNKPVEEMSMTELAHNSCYAKDRKARYRDYEMDIDARDFARKLMLEFGEWKHIEEYGLDADNELVDDEIFDDTMLDNLQYKPTTTIGLIALFYRNLWAMADLHARLKAYEDAEEQGFLLKKEKAVDEGYLQDWYIHSVTDDEPIWTEAHIEELFNDFILIPKEEAEQALARMEGENG